MLPAKLSIKFIFLLSTTLLAACLTSEPTPVALSRPTNQFTPTTNNPTPTTKLTATPIPPSIPSNTPSPPVQLTAAQTPAPTITFTPTPTSTPTHRVVSEFVSTNGEWIATVEEQFIGKGQNGDVNDLTLRVTNLEQQFGWIVEQYTADGWGSSYPWPLHFSNDDQYFYFTHTVLSDGCAPTGPFSNLVRFDLSTGKTIELVPSREAYNYIVSPDESKIAIIFHDSFVQIYDIASGGTRDVYFQFAPEPRELYMDVFWSPDSQYFLVEADIDTCYLALLSITYIYRINTTTLERSLLYAVEEPGYNYSVHSWPEMDLVLLWQGGVIWHMNPWTGEITAEIIVEE